MTPRKSVKENEEEPTTETVEEPSGDPVAEAWKLLANARPQDEADLASWRQARARWHGKWVKK